MSHLGLFISLFSKWPKTRRARVYFWRIVGLSAGLVLSTWLFILYNRVPTKHVDVAVAGYAIADAKIDLLLSLGRGTNIRSRFDSTYTNAFQKSGREGLAADIEAFHRPGEYFPFYREELPVGGKIGDYFPNDMADLEHISAMLGFHLKVEDIRRKPMMFGLSQKFHTDTLTREYPINNDLHRAYALHGKEVSRHRKDHLVRFESDDFVAFKDTLALLLYDERVSRKPSFFRNKSIWQASDISQEYVGIHLTKARYQLYKHDQEGYSMQDTNPLELTLSVDFGSPVTLSSMEPAPDSLTMTGMAFFSKDKIDTIIRDGLVIHVTYEENKNLQAVKLFWVTTIIAALLGLLCNQAFKWWHYRAQKRRLEKRVKERKME